MSDTLPPEYTSDDIDVAYTELVRRIAPNIQAEATALFGPELKFLQGRIARLFSTVTLLHPRCEEDVECIRNQVSEITLILLTMGYRCGQRQNTLPSFQLPDRIVEFMNQTPFFDLILARACITRTVFSQEAIFEAEDKNELGDLISAAVAQYSKEQAQSEPERDETYVC